MYKTYNTYMVVTANGVQSSTILNSTLTLFVFVDRKNDQNGDVNFSDLLQLYC